MSGASTICQQLVRIRLFDADLLADPDRIYERKIKEWILALRVGERYAGQEGKERILEMYMNQVYYGNQAYGIRAAARAYFGKDITSDDPDDQLTIGEAAMLVGLVRSAIDAGPDEGGGRADRRSRPARSWSWPTPPAPSGSRASCSTTWSSPATSPRHEADEAAAERDRAGPAALAPLPRPALRVRGAPRSRPSCSATRTCSTAAACVIDTTLQYDGYQRAAEKWARRGLRPGSAQRRASWSAKYGEAALGWIKQLQGRNINNDALVTLNYRTGAVIAYVGSANYYGRATPAAPAAFDVVGQAYPAVRVRRSSRSPTPPASSAACITPATMIMDVKGEIAEGYTVPNADGGERGPVRVRDALKYSWNIPVAKAQQLIGTENVVDMAERLGLQWDPEQEGRAWRCRR